MPNRGNGRPLGELIDATPPYDERAETGVLASCMLDPGRIDEVAALIGPEHFYKHAHRRLYEHLVALHANGGGGDVTLLVARLQDHGDLELVGGSVRLAEILHSQAVAVHASHYARIVRDYALRRNLASRGLDIFQEAMSGQVSGESLAARVRGDLEAECDQAATDLFPFRSYAELMREDFSERYLIDGLLVERQPLIIGGPAKSMKTTILMAAAFALSMAKPFLGKFAVKTAVRIGVMSAESGGKALRSILKRITESYGLDPLELEPQLHICEDVPRIDNPEHEAGIRQRILSHELEVIAFDPFYLGADDESQSNMARQGQQLRRLAKLCTDMGVTPVFCHHTTKPTFAKRDPLDLVDLHGAGVGEFTRQWWLVNRRADYRDDGHHELWFRVGASSGHGGLWGLDINEGVWDGPDSRYWEVAIQEPQEARQEARTQREAAKVEQDRQRLEGDRRRVVDALAKFPDGETSNVLRTRAAMSGTRFNVALASLLDDGDVQECQIVKAHRKQPFTAYKLAE